MNERDLDLACHCDDCQVFAQYLGQAGSVPDAQGSPLALLSTDDRRIADEELEQYFHARQ